MMWLLLVLAFLLGGLTGWWLHAWRQKRGTLPHTGGWKRGDVKFRVVVRKPGNRAEEIHHGPEQGASARQTYFRGMEHPEAERVEFWDRPTPGSDYVLRSEWERG